MDAVEFLKEEHRMKSQDPKSYDEAQRFTLLEDYVRYVRIWSTEHPRKTRLQDFLEKHPNAFLDKYGTPNACAGDLGYCDRDCPYNDECDACWRKPLDD